MTDIYDIQGIALNFPINLKSTIFLILFFIFSFFLIKKYFLEEDKNNKNFEKIEKKIKKIDFNKIFSDFEKNFFDAEKNIFYWKLSEILRKIIFEKEKKDVSAMTFDEINSLKIPENLKNILKRIYFKGFQKDFKDWENARKSVFDDVRKIIT